MTMLPRAFTLFARAARPGRRAVSTQSGLAVHAEHRAQAPLEEFAPIKPTHNVHIATLHFRAHPEDLNDLKFFSTFAGKAARALGCPSSGIASLPTKTTKFATPRSPFAHKKSQEVFWRKVHKRCIKIYDTDRQVVRFLISYLRQNALPTVPFKVELIEYKELGWGKSLSPADEQVSLQSAIVERADELLKELAAEADGATEAPKAALKVEPPLEEQAAAETEAAAAQAAVTEAADEAALAPEAATEAAASPVIESAPEPEAPAATLEPASSVSGPAPAEAETATLEPASSVSGPAPAEAETSTLETAPVSAAPAATEPEAPATAEPEAPAKASAKASAETSSTASSTASPETETVPVAKPATNVTSTNKKTPKP